MRALLEGLFRDYYRDIYRYLRCLTGDDQLAQDLTSETFLEVFTSLAGFRGQSDVRTWLFTIARRRWIAHLKRQKRRPEEQALTLLLESPLPGPEAQAETGALLEALDRAMTALPQRTASVVRLRLSGLSFYEIGQALAVSETSARVIWFRARQVLKEALEKEGYPHV